jgi:SHS2 domain-containing protein
MAKDFYRLIDHTGDLGIVVTAPDKPTLFVHAARAMFDLLCDTERVNLGVAEAVHAEGRTPAELLRNWLAVLHTRHCVHHMLYDDFTITDLGDTHLMGFAIGEPYDPERHEILREIKAVTHHQLEFRQTLTGCEAQVIFDL